MYLHLFEHLWPTIERYILMLPPICFKNISWEKARILNTEMMKKRTRDLNQYAFKEDF